MKKTTERVLAGTDALHAIASGAPLGETLAHLVRDLELKCAGMLGSVLLVENGCVRHGAAPGLPSEYLAAIDGQAIGPTRGSCGTAAYTKEAVLVAHIETDARWTDLKDLALRFSLRACWSVPIFAADGGVIGTFALYSKISRRAAPTFVRNLREAASLAAIAARPSTERRSFRSHSRSRNSSRPSTICCGRRRVSLAAPLRWSRRQSSASASSPRRRAWLQRHRQPGRRSTREA